MAGAQRPVRHPAALPNRSATGTFQRLAMLGTGRRALSGLDPPGTAQWERAASSHSRTSGVTGSVMSANSVCFVRNFAT